MDLKQGHKKMNAISLAERNLKNRQNFIQMLYTCALLLLAFKNITDSSVIMKKPDAWSVGISFLKMLSAEKSQSNVKPHHMEEVRIKLFLTT